MKSYEESNNQLFKLIEIIKGLVDYIRNDSQSTYTTLSKIKEIIKSRRWITEGRGSYTIDDDEYREETRRAFDAIISIIDESDTMSYKLYDDALRKGEKCLQKVIPEN